MLCLAFAYGNWYDLSRVTLTRWFTAPRSCNVNKFFLFMRVTRHVRHWNDKMRKYINIYIRITQRILNILPLTFDYYAFIFYQAISMFTSLLSRSILKYSSCYMSNFYICIFLLNIKKLLTDKVLIKNLYNKEYFIVDHSWENICLIKFSCCWILFISRYVKTHCT